MKATFRSSISLASVTAHPCRSLPVEQQQQLAQISMPRAALSCGGNFGFSAASQRLALRRFAASHQAGEPFEPRPSPFSAPLASDQLNAYDLQRHRSKALPLYPRKIHQYRTLAEADLERSQLTLQDQFEFHDLDQWLLEDLCQQLQRYPIAQAELVKKTLRFFPEQPLYVLLVCPAAGLVEQSDSLIKLTLGTQIAQELCFSRELLVCLTSDTAPQLVERIQAKSRGNLLNLLDE